jgi:hypothetical protein
VPGHVHRPHAPAAAGSGAVVEQGAEPGVAVPRRDHPGTDRQQLEDGGDGGHARGETDRVPAFEAAHELLEGFPARSAVVAGVLASGGSARVGPEVRRGNERHVQRLPGPVLAAAQQG